MDFVQKQVQFPELRPRNKPDELHVQVIFKSFDKCNFKLSCWKHYLYNIVKQNIIM